MDRLRALGRWIGSLSSAGVVGGVYVAVGIVVAASGGAATDAASAVAVAVVAVYALLRPTRRGEVLMGAAGPVSISGTAHDLFALPRAAVLVPLLLLVVAALGYEDRDERA